MEDNDSIAGLCPRLVPPAHERLDHQTGALALDDRGKGLLPEWHSAVRLVHPRRKHVCLDHRQLGEVALFEHLHAGLDVHAA